MGVRGARGRRRRRQAASAGRVAVPPVLPICAQMPRAGGAPEPARGSGEQCGSKPWRAAGFSGGARTRKASAAALVALGLVAAGRADAGPDNGSSGGSHHSDGPGGSGGGGSFYGMYGLSAGEILSQGSPPPPPPSPALFPPPQPWHRPHPGACRSLRYCQKEPGCRVLEVRRELCEVGPLTPPPSRDPSRRLFERLVGSRKNVLVRCHGTRGHRVQVQRTRAARRAP